MALRDGMGFETLAQRAKPDEWVDRNGPPLCSFDVPALLLGEAGTGRARLARAMHYASLRSDKPFHAINLAGLPKILRWVELFGAKRGVLPGGVNKIGLAQKADRGTLFVEGIEHTSPALQMALWRLVDEGSFSLSAGRRRDDETCASSPGRGPTFWPVWPTGGSGWTLLRACGGRW